MYKANKQKTICFILCAMLSLLMMLLPGCSASQSGEDATQSEEPSQTQSGVTTVASETAVEYEYTAEDLEEDWDAATAATIAFNGASADVSGSGAVVSGGTVTISASGTYVLSGTLNDGQVMVNAGENDVVRLILNGASITNKTGAAIYAAQSEKLIITLAEGTQNTAVDGGENFEYTVSADEEPDAAIFSKDDLTINGSGTLSVEAGFENGIGSKDNLVVVNGTLNINAVNHGLRGRDMVAILDGQISVNAGNDGIQSNNDEDASKGWILLEGGVYTIVAEHDGIQAETALLISGGTYDITAGGGEENAASVTYGEEQFGPQFERDAATTDMATEMATDETTDAVSDSYKGIKTGTDLTITGGTFTLDCADDTLHANADLQISGGTFTLSSGDDGIHAEEALTISGGSIDITASYEGIEGMTVSIGGGTINIVSSDDGINSAGGSDSSLSGGRFGMDTFSSSEDCHIVISDGQISLSAGGDGVDSNGDITVSGGTIISLIDSTADNGAFDCDQGAFTVSGGTLIYGGSGVGNTPGEDSSQSYVYTDAGISAGAEVTVVKDGVTFASFTPALDCQSLAVSAPDIQSGESYEIYAGGSLVATVTAGSGGGSSMGGGNMGGGMGGGRGR